jgi:conjugal transfer mating pair stabilization protein TraG
MASISRSNGYQISDDMSQVIASRYAEMAASPEFRDLGAPSLTNTTPSPHQREVRNMIVGKILEQYAADGMAPVQAGLQDPVRRWGVCGGRLSFPCRRQRHDRRAAAAQDQRQGVSRKARMVHRERADMRRAMMQLGRQFRGGD